MIILPAKIFRKVISVCKHTIDKSGVFSMMKYIKLECDGIGVVATAYNKHSYIRYVVPCSPSSENCTAFIQPITLNELTATVKIVDAANITMVEQFDKDNLPIKVDHFKHDQFDPNYDITKCKSEEEPAADVMVNPKYLKDIVSGLSEKRAVRLQIQQNSHRLLINNKEVDAVLCGIRIVSEDRK